VALGDDAEVLVRIEASDLPGRGCGHDETGPTGGAPSVAALREALRHASDTPAPPCSHKRPAVPDSAG